MTGGAVLIARIGQIVSGRGARNAVGAPAEIAESVMAFQAQREDYRPLQQSRVGGAVRAVAGFAAIHTHRGMLEHERPALVDVALEARLFIALSLIDHAWP